MSSEKPNIDHSPPPAWKAEADKYWRQVNRWSEAFYRQHPAWFMPSRFGPALAAGLSLAWLAGGLFIVDQGNRGVVSRFGAYRETAMPGPHWHWPWPIETTKIVNVEQQRFIEIGYRDSGRYAKAANMPQESLMLTRDENILNVRLAVQYQIANARDYLYNVKDGEATLKQLTESVERAVIGRSDMDFVLTEGRSEIVAEIKREIQAAMDEYRAGIAVASVNLQDAQPPEEVQGAFEDAIRAREDKQRLINEAQAYSNEIIPKARGAAGRLLQEAEAYEAEKIAKAKGETARFEQLLVEYDKNPAITRKRLYLEAKETLYAGSRKILLESDRASPQFYWPMAQTSAAGSGHAETVPTAAPALESDKAPPGAAHPLRPSRSKP